MQRYIVTKEESIRHGQIRTSEHYPRFVMANSYEEAIEQMFRPEEFRPGRQHNFRVFKIEDEVRVRVVPKSNYDVVIESAF